jgi:hypothetical protein
MSKRISRRAPGGLNRRQFIYTSALAASSLAVGGYTASARAKFKSPSETLAFGIIGCTGKGGQDSQMMSVENIVALCDVDANALAVAAKKWPNARTYRDYRVMIDKEKDIDAVTVSIPDHQHAPAAMLAMQAGKHVYCQKPMAHAVGEARAMTLAARKYGVATQRKCIATRTARSGRKATCGRRSRTRFPTASIGICGSPPPRPALTLIIGPARSAATASRSVCRCIIRSCGAVGGISAAARWATWRVT